MSDVRRFTPVRAEKAAFQQREVRSSLRRAIAQAAPWGWDPVKVGAPTREAREEQRSDRRYVPT